MSKARRIQTVIRLRYGEMGQLQTQLSSVGLELANFERQRRELASARLEYASRLSAEGNKSIQTFELRATMLFVQKLDQAIEQLDQQLKARQALQSRLQEQWLRHRNTIRALDSIADRYQRLEQGIELQREQREADDRWRGVGDRFSESDDGNFEI